MLQAKESTEEVETSGEQQQLFLFNWETISIQN